MNRSLVGCVLGAVLALAATGAAAARPGQDPDWPCQAIKVPELSLAAIWAGPPVTPYEKIWAQDPEIAALAARISERRVPLAKAQAAITALATKAGENRKTKLLELLAGLYENLNDERASVIAGLDRFGARQIALAGLIRHQLDTLHGLQGQPQPDTAKIAAMGKQLHWEMRTFTERQRTTQYVCAVPDTIEHRLYALAQTIQQNLG